MYFNLNNVIHSKEKFRNLLFLMSARKNQSKFQNNVCSIKFRSKQSSNTVLCLLRNLMEQTLQQAHFLVDIQIWIDFYMLTRQEKYTFKLGSSLRGNQGTVAI